MKFWNKSFHMWICFSIQCSCHAVWRHLVTDTVVWYSISVHFLRHFVRVSFLFKLNMWFLIKFCTHWDLLINFSTPSKSCPQYGMALPGIRMRGTSIHMQLERHKHTHSIYFVYFIDFLKSYRSVWYLVLIIKTIIKMRYSMFKMNFE